MYHLPLPLRVDSLIQPHGRYIVCLVTGRRLAYLLACLKLFKLCPQLLLLQSSKIHKLLCQEATQTELSSLRPVLRGIFALAPCQIQSMLHHYCKASLGLRHFLDWMASDITIDERVLQVPLVANPLHPHCLSEGLVIKKLGCIKSRINRLMLLHSPYKSHISSSVYFSRLCGLTAGCCGSLDSVCIDFVGLFWFESRAW